MLWQGIAGLVIGLLLCWAVFVVVVWRSKPGDVTLSDAVRLLPDLLGLLARLARDSSLPRRVRLYLWLLLGYLAMPFDLVPDFIPVIGYADDAIVVVLVLRLVVRSTDVDAIRRHWHGSDVGLQALLQLSGAIQRASLS